MFGVMIRSLERMKRADYTIREEWGEKNTTFAASVSVIVERNYRTSHAVFLFLITHATS